MAGDKLVIIVSFAFILFTVIFTVGTASFVCIEPNDLAGEKENGNA